MWLVDRPRRNTYSACRTKQLNIGRCIPIANAKTNQTDSSESNIFSKLGHESLKAAFIKQIQHMIFDGELKPNQRLPAERDLARMMGISRSLVNAGILELESQGFIRVAPRQGSFVCDYRREGTIAIFTALMNYDADLMDPALFEGMLAARSLIECECARLACKNARPEDLSRIEAQLDIMEANPINEEFIKASVEYHQVLTIASQNAVYSMLFRSISPAVRHFTTLHYTGDASRQRVLALHRGLLNALRGGDAQRAVEAARVLLLPGETALKRKIKARREER